MIFAKIKEKLEIAQIVVTIAAIITGGVWTYAIFIKERSGKPHAHIGQRMFHLPVSKDQNLLRLEVTLENIGQTKIIFDKALIQIRRILPVDPGDVTLAFQLNGTASMKKIERFTWTPLVEKNISYQNCFLLEPGEKQTIDYEFAVSPRARVIRVYSYFRNESIDKSDPEIGWAVSSYYSFDKKQEGLR